MTEVSEKEESTTSYQITSGDSVETVPRIKTGPWASVKKFGRAIQPYIWDSPDKTKEEKWFLFKLDFFLLTYSCLSYLCKNLDQSNLSNAYTSGLKEAIGMEGSDLTYMTNVFAAGYVVGQLPAVVLITRVRPSIYIPTVEVLWAICTFCESAVKTVAQLYVIRFFIGLCEASFFPCMIYLISSWYKKDERAKRVVIFYCTTSLAAMFSGYLQAGAYSGLNGVSGREGWQWLFIICGIITLPIALSGYVLNPDFPENTRAFYITEKEAEFARKRLLDEGLQPLGAHSWDKTKFFRMAKHWQFWVLPIGYFFVQASLPSQQPAFALWLKAENYSLYDYNVLPTSQYGLAVIVQVAAGMLSDSPLLRGRRWQGIVVMQVITLFGTVVLAIWNVSNSFKIAAYILSYASSGVPGLYYAWFSELIPGDHEMRGFLIGASNMMGYVNSIWYSDAVWRTAESPEFRPGFIAASVLNVALLVVVAITRLLEVRDDKVRRNTRPEDLEETSSISEEVTTEITEKS